MGSKPRRFCRGGPGSFFFRRVHRRTRPAGSISVASRDARLHYRPMAPAMKASASIEALAGVVERVTFHNGDNGFCVLRVKARGQRDLITILGHAAMVSAGEFVQASGSWINDRTHGVQFRASFLKATPPTTTEGIEKYLGSGMIRGIGPIYARKLVRAFSDAVFDVIEQEPGRLREVTGIGPKRAERIVAGWAEQKVIREIMLFLHSNGVGTSRAVRIYKTYGAEAVQRISENPIAWLATSAASASAPLTRSRPSSASKRPRRSACAPASPLPSLKRWTRGIAGSRQRRWSLPPQNCSKCRPNSSKRRCTWSSGPERSSPMTSTAAVVSFSLAFTELSRRSPKNSRHLRSENRLGPRLMRIRRSLGVVA